MNSHNYKNQAGLQSNVRLAAKSFEGSSPPKDENSIGTNNKAPPLSKNNWRKMILAYSVASALVTSQSLAPLFDGSFQTAAAYSGSIFF